MKRIDLVLYLLAVLILISAAIPSLFVYQMVDDWQGNIPGALVPFSTGAMVYAFVLGPLIYAWGILYTKNLPR